MFWKYRTIRSTLIGEERIDKDFRIVDNFIAENDVPGWYRGLSSFQIKAAQNLHSALRDDAEQNTAHRVLDCLNLIGLKPAISPSSAKFLMRISRCNDLAFLWFLMDVHYKTNGTRYSLNEQIIMSCIATLDMVTTMRALDQILPPPQPTKKELERRQRGARMYKKNLSQQSELDLLRSRHRPKYSLPYFIPLERPRPFGKPLTSTPQDHKMNFGIFEEYSNQNFVVHNENNRWYANYEMQPTRRIAAGVKNELLRNILARINADDIVTRHNNTRFGGCDNSTDDEPEDEKLVEKSMCEKHRVIDELQKSLEHELKAIARDRCLKYFDVVTSKKEATRKRIQEQLEHDVTLYTEQFRRLADSTRKSVSRMHLVTTDDFCEYSPDDINKENLCPARNGRCTRLKSGRKSLNQQENAERAHERQKLETPVGDCQRKRSLQQRKHSENYRNTIGDGPRALAQHIRQIARGDTCDCDYEYVQSYDYGHSERRSESSTFFAAPTDHQPYHFDYRKIFNLNDHGHDAYDASSNIHRTCLKAVDSDAHLENKDPLEPLDMDGAVKKTAKRIFQKELAIHQQQELDSQRYRMKNKKTTLDYDAAYYDPDDTSLMNKMLEDALALLAQDHKYVLASMLDAHKYPVLRLWMYRRFGKVFSRAELDKSWKKSARIFHSLYNLTLDVMMPSARALGPALYVNYSCRDYIMQKTKHIREVYYKHLDAAIMEQSRAFYLAMTPFMCTGGPPRNTYFAYMPPRTMDIHHFHVWKPSEFIHAKKAHDLRIARESKRITLSADYGLRL